MKKKKKKHGEVKSHTSQEHEPQTKEEWFQRRSPTGVKVQSPTSCFPVWESGTGTGIPRESAIDHQRDLITCLPEHWGKQRCHSWRAQTKPCMPQDLWERSSDSTRDWSRQTYLLVLQMWLGGGSLQGQRHWQQQSWKLPFGISSLGSCH